MQLSRFSSAGRPWTRPSTILELEVPSFERSRWQRLNEPLRQIQSHAGVSVTPQSVSRWGVTDLSQFSRWLIGAVLEPAHSGSSHPLETLCQSIRRGSVRTTETVDIPVEGWIPVASTGDINRGTLPRRWIQPNETVDHIGHEGDVVMGLIGERAVAAVLASDAAIDHNVALIRFSQPDVQARVVGYLNSAQGLSARRSLTTGNGVPHLSMRSLRDLPVPDSFPPADGRSLPTWPSVSHAPRTSETSGRVTKDLASRLQELLWPS